MDYILKACALVLVTTILCLLISKKSTDIASVLTATACCLVIIGAVAYLEPILDLLQQFQQLGNLDSTFLGILLKATGISLLVEVCSLFCSDLGNSALAKTLQISASAVILWLALPLFSELLSILTDIMEGL